MSTKKIQILGSFGVSGGDADTLDGMHASDFATADAVSTLQSQVGDESVSVQISNAIGDLDNLVYVSEEYQESAVVPINADTLGGYSADSYVKQSDLPTTIDADTLDGMHASEFATLDDVDALRQEILGGAW